MRVLTILALAALLAACLAPAALADDNEKPGKDGRPAWVRFFIGADGMGTVKCANCSTAAGCTSLWIQVGYPATCTATPAPGQKFAYWSANGNYAGTNNPRKFSQKGATLKGHFQAAE